MRINPSPTYNICIGKLIKHNKLNLLKHIDYRFDNNKLLCVGI